MIRRGLPAKAQSTTAHRAGIAGQSHAVGISASNGEWKPLPPARLTAIRLDLVPASGEGARAVQCRRIIDGGNGDVIMRAANATPNRVAVGAHGPMAAKTRVVVSTALLSRGRMAMTKRVRFILLPALLCLLCIAVLLAVEGLASSIVVGRLAVQRSRLLAERTHVRYDSELGWVNIPDLFVPDMYGRGVFLRTNVQGFRNDRPFPKAVPAGRLRVICSGDSFTLGYGVSNDDAWCNQLPRLDARFETVNMGQGGYGIDQAWLWYRRDGIQLDHDLHLFAFIADDFSRMRRRQFLGYAKPFLALENETVVVRNVPVPRQSMLALRLRSAIPALNELRSAQLTRQLLGLSQPPPTRVPDDLPRESVPRVAEAVFASLQAFHRQRGSTLVLVYLPGQEESRSASAQEWRGFARDAAARHGIAFIELVPELDRVPRHELSAYFIQPGELPYPDGEGHYTALGNAVMAKALLATLTALEPIASKLRALHPPSGSTW